MEPLDFFVTYCVLRRQISFYLFLILFQGEGWYPSLIRVKLYTSNVNNIKFIRIAVLNLNVFVHEKTQKNIPSSIHLLCLIDISDLVYGL